MSDEKKQYAAKFTRGFLCVQGKETWYQDKPIGWCVVNDDKDYVQRVAECWTNSKQFEIVEIN